MIHQYLVIIHTQDIHIKLKAKIMIKNSKLLPLAALTMTLIGCNGGGGGGSSSETPTAAHTPLTYSIEQVDQFGFSDTFLPNGKTVLDLRPFQTWSYFYIYFTNNQSYQLAVNPRTYPVHYTEAKNSLTESVAQPNDSLDCANAATLKVGAQCRVLMRTVRSTYSHDHSAQVESFNSVINYGYCWPDSQVSDGYSCNSSSAGLYAFPQIKVPSIGGLWTVASSGSPIGGDKLFSLTLDGSSIFTNYPTAYAAEAKYPITYNKTNGTAWIDFTNPTQIYNYVGDSMNVMYTYNLQPVGESDGTLWAQNGGGLNFNTAVYQYGANTFYSIPTWLTLSDVSISLYNQFTNGGDGNLYLYGGDNANYRFNGVTFIALNIPQCVNVPHNPLGCGNGIVTVAKDGTILREDGCYKTTDGVNYSFTPFSGAFDYGATIGFYDNKIWYLGREVDTDKCIINKYPKYQSTMSILPGQGYFNATTNGFFGSAEDGNIYFYPPNSYWK